MKKENESFVFVYQTETDGEIVLTTIKGLKEVKAFEETLRKKNISKCDYAIIRGDVVKTF